MPLKTSSPRCTRMIRPLCRPGMPPSLGQYAHSAADGWGGLARDLMPALARRGLPQRPSCSPIARRCAVSGGPLSPSGAGGSALQQPQQMKSFPLWVKEDHLVLGSLRRVVLIPLVTRKSFAAGIMKNFEKNV